MLPIFGVIYVSNPVPLIVTGAILYKLYRNAPDWLANGSEAIKKYFTKNKAKKGTGDESLDKIIESAGYAYDRIQDIFYSILNAWQRKMGYCRLYDEMAAPTGMIADCEPVYFDYGGKRWLIEFWKGQYDLTCGCEIGVYTTTGPDLNIPDIFNGTFYHSANDEDLLQMSFRLYKSNEEFFTRNDKHWWLTGFKLGEFAEPSELSMDIEITLKDEEMRDSFVEGLKKAGYKLDEIKVDGNTVQVKYDKPRTAQPITRTKETDWIIQRKNKLMCDMYKEITGPYDNFIDKMNAVKVQSPDLYEKIINMGKTRKLFETFESIKSHL